MAKQHSRFKTELIAQVFRHPRRCGRSPSPDQGSSVRSGAASLFYSILNAPVGNMLRWIPDQRSSFAVTRAFHVLFESQTLHETQDYQYLKLVGLVQFKPDRL